MTFTVEDHPGAGSVTAGGMASTRVNVTSVDGVVGGPITMSVGGMNPGGGGSLGTEDLTGHHCTPSTSTTIFGFTYVQPGSNCMLSMDVSTNPAASPGTYTLTIKGSPPANVPDSATWSVVNIGSEDNAPYQLTIQKPGPPIPVIYTPSNLQSYPEKSPVTLIGYAIQYLQGQLAPSYLSCSQLQFQAAGQKVTPTPDSSYQMTGYCDAQMTFTVTGSVSITLTATNKQGQTAAVEVIINIVSSTGISGATPFTFTLTASPQDSGITVGGSSSHIMVHITCLTGCSSPQPVHLQVSGLPSQAKTSFDVNTPHPTQLAPSP